MKTNYVVREFDPYDGYTFSYHVFDNKASAKSFARHTRCPFNVGACVWSTTIKAPILVKIEKSSPFFALLENDGFYLDDYDYDQDDERKAMLESMAD